MEKKKQYTASRRVQEAQEAVQEHRKSRPGDFASDDDGRLKDAMDALLSRKEFQYRLDGDALYRRYHAQAVRDGRRAMADTMGQAAALTGGYGSSYAQTAGQQAYARQLEGAADRIPELYALAMEQYRLQSQGLKDKYDLLSGERDAEYGRYRDSLAAWQTEAERLQREYADAREQDYGAYRDDVDDWKWQQEFEESRRRYDQQWEAEHPTDAPRVTTVYRTKKDGKEKKSTGFLGALLSAVTAASLRRK